MDRRLFITRALAGLATVPLLGELIKAKSGQETIQSVDGFHVYDKLCPYDFSKMRVLSAAELRRKQVLGYLQANEYIETTAEAVSRLFEDFDHDQIDAWCMENDLIIYVQPTRLIKIRHTAGLGYADVDVLTTLG